MLESTENSLKTERSIGEVINDTPKVAFIGAFKLELYKRRERIQWIQRYLAEKETSGDTPVKMETYLRNEHYPDRRFTSLELSELALDFSKADLTNMDFSYCQFGPQTNFAGTVFCNTNLSGCKGLTQAMLADARLDKVILFDEILEGAQQANCQLYQVILEGSRLYTTVKTLSRKEVDASDDRYSLTQKEFVEAWVRWIQHMEAFQSIVSMDLSAFKDTVIVNAEVIKKVADQINPSARYRLFPPVSPPEVSKHQPSTENNYSLYFTQSANASSSN